jgi:voltage-gated potassium channel
VERAVVFQFQVFRYIDGGDIRVEFTIAFVDELMWLTYHFLPLFIAPSLVIICLALWVGTQEKWGKGDSIYFGFITATTVGYGDFHPKKNSSKFAAIIISIVGLIMTGILVAISLEAVDIVIDAHNITLSR